MAQTLLSAGSTTTSSAASKIPSKKFKRRKSSVIGKQKDLQAADNVLPSNISMDTLNSPSTNMTGLPNANTSTEKETLPAKIVSKRPIKSSLKKISMTQPLTVCDQVSGSPGLSASTNKEQSPDKVESLTETTQAEHPKSSSETDETQFGKRVCSINMTGLPNENASAEKEALPAKIVSKTPIKSSLKKTSMTQPIPVCGGTGLPVLPNKEQSPDKIETSGLTETTQTEQLKLISETDVTQSAKRVWQPPRETRSMTEQKKMIFGHRVVSRNFDVSTEEEEERESSEVEDFGQHFSGGITKNHDTENVDIVFKNSTSSLEITILPGVEPSTAAASTAPAKVADSELSSLEGNTSTVGI